MPNAESMTNDRMKKRPLGLCRLASIGTWAFALIFAHILGVSS